MGEHAEACMGGEALMSDGFDTLFVGAMLSRQLEDMAQAQRPSLIMTCRKCGKRTRVTFEGLGPISTEQPFMPNIQRIMMDENPTETQSYLARFVTELRTRGLDPDQYVWAKWQCQNRKCLAMNGFWNNTGNVVSAQSNEQAAKDWSEQRLKNIQETQRLKIQRQQYEQKVKQYDLRQKVELQDAGLLESLVGGGAFSTLPIGTRIAIIDQNNKVIRIWTKNSDAPFRTWGTYLEPTPTGWSYEGSSILGKSASVRWSPEGEKPQTQID
jgi:hypothetical protein